MRKFFVHFQDIAGPDDAAAIMKQIGTDTHGVTLMKNKMVHYTLRVGPLPARAANIVKQEMLSVGGDAAVARGVIDCSAPDGPVLLSATRKQFRRFLQKMRAQPFSLPKLADQIQAAISCYERPAPYLFTCRGITVDLQQQPLIMGILNVTPDSFSDGSRYQAKEQALEHARQMIADGAAIIDIGGESTRPGAAKVTLEQELERVIPVIEALRAERDDIPLSIDTYKSDVAREALASGADMVNDISAGRYDSGMAGVVAATEAYLCLMHIQGTPDNMQEHPEYREVIEEIISSLEESVDLAVQNGVAREKLFIDPGIGFGKTLAHNLTILKHLREFRVLGLPILIGTSRKSFIGRLTGKDVDDRLAGTIASIAHAVWSGGNIIRVHDVGAARDAIQIINAIRQADRYGEC
ncbi:MAG: dihydropteroate synthase [Deltaproteobacteria bacterium]|nr:dihydropteroate synthase [Candidatus Anaeroferrophillus wilburensis]MBN2888271.1 dihydropteroate synthase [Deltaproteobacteria bacterium]